MISNGERPIISRTTQIDLTAQPNLDQDFGFRVLGLGFMF